MASGMRSLLGDVRDLSGVKAAMAECKPEIVIHMAAQSLVRVSYADPILTYLTNVMGTANVLEAVRETPSVSAALVVTSDKCYENRNSPHGYRESDPLGGHDPYSSSKACAELVVGSFRSSFFESQRGDDRPVAVASARAGNVIGGGDWAQDRLIPDIVKAFSEGNGAEDSQSAGDAALAARSRASARILDARAKAMRERFGLCRRLELRA